MAAHMSHSRRGSGGADPVGEVCRPKPARSGRAARARRYVPLSGQLLLPGLDDLHGAVSGGAPRTASGTGRGGDPVGISAWFGRLCARGRAPRRTERRCEGAGFRLPGRRRPRRGALCDGGMSTAEYALGTVSAVAFAGVLYVILTGGTVTEVLTDIVVDALSSGM